MGKGRRLRKGRGTETYRAETDEELQREVGRKFTQRRRKEI